MSVERGVLLVAPHKYTIPSDGRHLWDGFRAAYATDHETWDVSCTRQINTALRNGVVRERLSASPAVGL